MYEQHFELAAQPFGVTPDPAYLYLSPGHREALAAIEYGLLDRRGFITLVGEVGTGKTTLLYSLLGRLGPEVQAAYIAYTTQRFEHLLAGAMQDLGVTVRIRSKRHLLAAFKELLEQRAAEGRTVALVIDEAQNLEDGAFEELRLLSNFETHTGKLLQIVLVGQPELQERLHRRQLRQVQERVTVRAFINPLPRAEMRRYIEHRLQRVGGSSAKLFSPLALTLIVWRSRGVPRRANILCHNALLFAFGRGLPRVTAGVAREVVAEMDERLPGLVPRAALRRLPRPGRRVRRAAALALAASVVVAAPRLAPLVTSATERLFGASTDAPDAQAPAEPAPIVGERAAVATPAADPPPAAAPAPADEAAAPAPAEPAPAPETAPARPPAAIDTGQIEVAVHPGATLFGLMRRVYGRDLDSGRFLQMFPEVLRLNPQVKDVDAILAGDSLRLPPPSAVRSR